MDNFHNTAMIGRLLSTLHRKITSESELSDRELCETISLLRSEGAVEVQNETRVVHRLQMHLTYQKKLEEAKRFYESFQKLKGMEGGGVLKNRDKVMALFYELFDKETTREAYAAMRQGKSQSGSVSKVDVDPMGMPRLNFASPDKYKQLQEDLHRNQSKLPDPRLPTRTSGVVSMAPPSQPLSTAARLAKDHQSSSRPSSARAMNGRPPTAVSGSISLRPGSNNMEEVLMRDSLFTSPGGIRLKPQENGIGSRNAAFSSGSKGPIPHSGSHPSALAGILTGNSSVATGRGLSLRSDGIPSNDDSSYRKVETALIRDLVFVFQGIDGILVKSTKNGDYCIDTSTRPVHPGLQLEALRLAELGYSYKKAKAYSNGPMEGQMGQGFKFAVDKELQEYYRLLANLQAQVQQTIVDTPMSDDMAQSPSGEDMTMTKLTVWVYDVRPRLDALSCIVSHCQSRRGGDLCTELFKYASHGDPMILSLIKSILSETAKPMYLMVCQWILYGELEDPGEEFFIAADHACKKENLWHSKYSIRKSMLPNFISYEQAEMILATGKNINFLRETCNYIKGFDGRGKLKAWLEKSPVECLFARDDKVLTTAFEKAYKTTSKMVLDVLIQEARLLDHLKAIKSYMLLGQGDFVQYFLELIQGELSKPACRLYSHNVAAILESAIRATNAQFEHEDVLSRLDIRLLSNNDRDIGWDVFCLDYKVHGPIGTVLTEDAMIGYNRLFNALWRIKRIEIILDAMWKDQAALYKCQKSIPELGPVLHRSQLLISEMIHFIHQTQYYIMFEAMECAWDDLMTTVNKAIDLDEVIVAHKRFLVTITKRSLLDGGSRQLLAQLRGIFSNIHELSRFLIDFDRNVAKEMSSRKAAGLSARPTTEDEQKEFFTKYIRQAKGKIETLYTTTQDLVRGFLLILNRQPDLTLQCLSFRLDFNEYYNLQDSRLNVPLTFHHRRMSSNTFDPRKGLTACAANHALLYKSPANVIQESP